MEYLQILLHIIIHPHLLDGMCDVIHNPVLHRLALPTNPALIIHPHPCHTIVHIAHQSIVPKLRRRNRAVPREFVKLSSEADHYRAGADHLTRYQG